MDCRLRYPSWIDTCDKQRQAFCRSAGPNDNYRIRTLAGLLGPSRRDSLLGNFLTPLRAYLFDAGLYSNHAADLAQLSEVLACIPWHAFPLRVSILSTG